MIFSLLSEEEVTEPSETAEGEPKEQNSKVGGEAAEGKAEAAPSS